MMSEGNLTQILGVPLSLESHREHLIPPPPPPEVVYTPMKCCQLGLLSQD